MVVPNNRTLQIWTTSYQWVTSIWSKKLQFSPISYLSEILESCDSGAFNSEPCLEATIALLFTTQFDLDANFHQSNFCGRLALLALCIRAVWAPPLMAAGAVPLSPPPLSYAKPLLIKFCFFVPMAASHSLGSHYYCNGFLKVSSAHTFCATPFCVIVPWGLLHFTQI